MQRFPLSLIALTILCGCDYYDDRLLIHNKTLYNFYIETDYDTTLTLQQNETFIMSDRYVPSGKSKRILIPGKNAWDSFIEKSAHQQLHVFILSEDSLLKYRSDKVDKSQIYQKRIILDRKELEKNNWEVVVEN